MSTATVPGGSAGVPLGGATIADLERVREKAELIDGRIEYIMPTGDLPGEIGGRIYRRLADHVDAVKKGKCYPDGVGFTVPILSSRRQSFAPDVAYYDGPLSKNRMKFINAPPTFAVEVRSEHDYTAKAERDIAQKRADYFEAGTLVVWDVDPIAQTITTYLKSDPDHPVAFSRGQEANAEPAVQGWLLDTEWLFACE